MKMASAVLQAVFFFCGIGGGSIGFKNAGFRGILAVDNNPDAREAHRQFAPDVPVDGADLRLIHPADVLRRYGINPDTFAAVIMCSPPCPGFANCGKRDPDAQTNELIRIPALLAAACPHAWIVVENVRGLLAVRNRPRLLDLLGALRACGRDVPTVKELRQRYVFDAQRYGVPQHRERIFIMVPPPGIQKIEPPAPTTTTTALAGQTIGTGSGFIDPDPRAIPLTVTEAVCYLRAENPWTQEYMRLLGKSSRLLRPQRLDRVFNAVIAHVGNGATGRVSLIHPSEARLLSIGERMAAQCLPLDRGPIPADLIAAHRLVGDAIPPPLAEAIARQIKRAMGLV